ncbi:large ribosomal subunit protein bL36m isoform 1-T3 [Thomomys bottae]
MAAAFLRAVVASVVDPLLRVRPGLPGLAGPRACSASPVLGLPGLPGPRACSGLPGLAGPRACPASPLPSFLQPALGFKTKVVIKKRCRDCYLVKRRGRWFVLCRTNPKHKQRQK